MLKLIVAEFKKIFKKTGIFVVTGLLVFVLAASIFSYKPFTRSNSRISITGATVYDIFVKFDQNVGIFSKIEFDHNLQQAQYYIDFYSDDYNYKQTLIAQVNTLNSLYENYLQKYLAGINPAGVVTARANLKTAFENFVSEYQTNVVSRNEYYYVLATDDLNNKVSSLLANCLNLFKDGTTDEQVLNDLDNFEFYNKLTSYIGELIAFTPDATFVQSLSSYLQTADTRINAAGGIYDQIVIFKDAHSSSASTVDKYEINTLISMYYLTTTETLELVRDSILLNVLNHYSNSAINSYNGFESVNLYQVKEELTRNQYLLASGTYDFQYANALNVSSPSNMEINAFDFSHYALRLCAFIIIIYCIVLGAGSIAGESSSGTLKFLAIRPYSRRKILSAKILSVLMVGLMLLVISSVVTLIVGGITFGFNSATILTVFNATTAFTIHPFGLYVIMFISILLEMIFFALLALAISTIFTSSVGAVAIGVLSYFITMVLNSLLLGVPALQYIPLTCINFYRFFGGSFLSTSGDSSLINKLLTPGIAAGTSIYISFAIFAVTLGLIVWLTYYIFRKRDIK